MNLSLSSMYHQQMYFFFYNVRFIKANHILKGIEFEKKISWLEKKLGFSKK